MSAIVSPGKKIWTEVELEALPDDGFIHEVVDGELVMSPKNNFQHENIIGRLVLALHTFNRRHRLRVIRGSNAGYWMANKNCRAPDISFIPRQRLEVIGFSPSDRKFFPGAPDLAIEVLSPNDKRSETHRRLTDFFPSGTQVAWVIDPETASVQVYHGPESSTCVGPDAELNGEHLLPGFHYRVADLFKEWDWE